MPETPNKVLIIGSGPIIVGQAAEFDYSGSQACKALREEGVEVVLVNSNPATIMTDPNMADRVYLEPLDARIVAKIIEEERPDGILPTLGGQTGLNIAVELDEMGVLEEYDVEVLGTSVETIVRAEDRDEFRAFMKKIGEPVCASEAVSSVEEAKEVAEEIGYPVVVRPAYTLGGTGGGIAEDEEELKRVVERGLEYSRVNQVLIEEYVGGWAEIEYEVMRDGSGNCITVCSMENVDPMGVHTGESIVVAPAQTLTEEEHQMLRSAALHIIDALGVEGGCNIQFALHRETGEYRVIEVNPRVSRSSALASKATGYPIARIAAKIAIGLRLDEIENQVTGETYAAFEPALDYVVVKIPRWPFDKFPEANRTLGTEMKSVGEVMAIGRTFEEALQKAIRSLEIGEPGLGPSPEELEADPEEIRRKIETPNDRRIFCIYAALKRGLMSVEEISELSGIDPWFVEKVKRIVEMEHEIVRRKDELLEFIRTGEADEETVEFVREVKRTGFSDEQIAELLGVDEDEIREARLGVGVEATYKLVDTCAAEFAAVSPYFYSTYEEECEALRYD
ncbi:TPA: carbamoyl-phosphate synthase large subunit [Methanopyrus kandleri]|uniref:Carbamoyl phosphate synthase large chain, N-terminal section n=2 Tax=Methanopyrus kandleri TaxID=2320 RepID=CARB1_METKA|nr:carbamoyl-phosphate synthase large subunit [Methanopyrus kandleri]Q8TWX0.1 RecName: Full=Carbamoyl phosphate synthase large chain, N-terminal section; AltName: Full=Carbamoyl phosphate synthetase ammonia chain [Methanopyrus kandleri AV19]AAM02124.1 Carbamoylphosphate synthase large subunit [Methanopyrus kandleri AV19]HII69861.1 carbamoyl-phosphate synthase large subunit [Methanopyrus kandleri]